MIRAFGRKIALFITENIPDPIKLVFFYGLAFYAGYIVGDFGYNNYEDVVVTMCQLYQPQ